MHITPRFSRAFDAGRVGTSLIRPAFCFCPSGKIAEIMERTSQQLSSLRSRLLHDSIIEAPGYGKVAFAIPYMREYLNERRAEFEAELKSE